jgi:hypothetical protein
VIYKTEFNIAKSTINPYENILKQTFESNQVFLQEDNRKKIAEDIFN